MINEEIANKIRLVRRERGMTQADIAAFLNKTAATVSDIERGKIQVSAADLFTIASVVNKPVEYFFGENYSTEAIDDLVAYIRSVPLEMQQTIIDQTKMLVALQQLTAKAESKGELPDEDIKILVNAVFSYADEIEKIYHQVMEARNSLRAAFQAQGIDEIEILKNKNI
ncbi:MAG: helix-turn-helix transcriptional regulator [Anaerolineaceae bacterium]|nr:helix-turn-helix transcriptional regulator [Anaerolineaceae bacterium]